MSKLFGVQFAPSLALGSLALKQMTTSARLPSSFRDPAGYIFESDGQLYRAVDRSFASEFDALISSGLYDLLAEKSALVSHEEIDATNFDLDHSVHCVLKPEWIPFISYPYEWSFEQLRDAALHTLKIQKSALKHGMSLKDASAYNIQFHRGQPVFIDTLSFEKKQSPGPWVAYRQFCQHFLAPLLLMRYGDLRINKLTATFLDGVPLDIASRLLPALSYLNPSVLTHVHIHAKSIAINSNTSISSKARTRGFSNNAQLGLLDNLYHCVQKLQPPKKSTQWGDYYSDTSYSEIARASKERLVGLIAKDLQPKVVWDIGGNTGEISRISSLSIPNSLFICLDGDPLAVDRNYKTLRERREKNILPLVVDIANPTPPIGWGNAERYSLQQRGPCDLGLMLAVVHHLAITCQVPFHTQAKVIAQFCRSALIEFVPPDDVQVKRLLQNRPDFPYAGSQAEFLECYSRYFSLVDTQPIEDSGRTLHLFKSI